MKIQPITNNLPYSQRKNTTTTRPSFVGKYYGDTYYSDDEIDMCKQYLDRDNWENQAQDELERKYTPSNDEFGGEDWLIFIPGIGVPARLSVAYIQYKKIDNKIKKCIQRLSNLRPYLLNEKIQDQLKEQENLLEEAIDENIILEAKNKLKNKFISKLSMKSPRIPTAIMLFNGKEKNRIRLLKWIKEQASPNCAVMEYDCHQDLDSSIYYLQTQADYANQRFEKSDLRTLLILNNFDKILKEDSPSLKELLSSLSEEEIPITLVFQTQNPKDLASPYTGNASRIPLKIKIDDSLIEDAKIEEERKIRNSFKQYYNGYKYDDRIELYLGDLGYNDKILYVNTHNGIDVKEIIDKIKYVKEIDKFKNVKVIQAPLSTNTMSVGKNLENTYIYTSNYEPIYQINL